MPRRAPPKPSPPSNKPPDTPLDDADAEKAEAETRTLLEALREGVRKTVERLGRSAGIEDEYEPEARKEQDDA